VRALAVAVALGAAPALAQDGGVPFLHGIGLESALPAGAKLDGARLVMRTPPGSPLFLRRRAGLTADGGVVSVDLSAGVEPKDAPQPRHRTSTWLVDFSEKAFAKVWQEPGAAKPTPDGLTAFASSFIARKSLRRGFDLASQVARSKEGDCTEHAVFLAALLRHAKLPARVMLGLVVVVFEGRPQAFGHAWTEVWEKDRWRVADAAIPKELGAVYLPTEEVVEEGPGFAVALVPGVQALALEGLKLEPR
jgi:hypothetical protein